MASHEMPAPGLPVAKPGAVASEDRDNCPSRRAQTQWTTLGTWLIDYAAVTPLAPA